MKCSRCGSAGPFDTRTWQVLLNHSTVTDDSLNEHSASIEWVSGFVPGSECTCKSCGLKAAVESFDDRLDSGEMPFGVWSPLEALADYERNEGLLLDAMIHLVAQALPNGLS